MGLSVMALALVASGCGNKGDSAAKSDLPDARFKVSKTEPSWKKDKKHSAKLTWYVNFDWYKRSAWGVDAVSKQIKKDMNIDVKFISGNDDKLNTMMASGDLPDLMTFDRALSVAQSGKKFALPLNKLAEKYDPYFTETAAKKQTLKWYTESDGNIYGYPSFSTTEEDYKAGNVVGDQTFIVRKDIYEKIGKPDMSTPESFLAALKKAQEVQPKTDDGAALIPFGSTALDIQNGGDGALGDCLQNFLSIPVVKNGKYNDREKDKDYFTWLDTFREAYNDGLIANSQFADNDNTMKEKLAQGTYFAYLHNNTKGLNEFMSNNTRRNAKETYIAIDGPKNAAGDQSTFTGGTLSGWTNTFITKDTKEPQKAMELLTYLASHYGTMVATFGTEGTNYTLQDGKAVFTEATESLRNSDITTYDKKMGMGNYWFVSDDSYAIEKGQLPATSIRQMVEWANGKLESRFEIENVDPTPGTKLARNQTTIKTDKVQALVKLIKAKSSADAESIWKSYLSSRDNNGFKEITDYRNKQVKANIARLK